MRNRIAHALAPKMKMKMNGSQRSAEAKQWDVKCIGRGAFRLSLSAKRP